jgi:Ca2+-binding EF-hand superfamily protein
MTQSKQFKEKKDANDFFNLLDQEQKGLISFPEFLSPLISQLSD